MLAGAERVGAMDLGRRMLRMKICVDQCSSKLLRKSHARSQVYGNIKVHGASLLKNISAYGNFIFQ